MDHERRYAFAEGLEESYQTENMAFHSEETDLGRVAKELANVFEGGPPKGYLPGRTALRDAVVSKLACSQLEAEQIVDTMISRGFLRYEGAASTEIDDLQPWSIHPTPGAPI
jgi:hypothetical protein